MSDPGQDDAADAGLALSTELDDLLESLRGESEPDAGPAAPEADARNAHGTWTDLAADEPGAPLDGRAAQLQSEATETPPTAGVDAGAGEAGAGTAASDPASNELGAELDDLLAQLQAAGTGTGAQAPPAANGQVGAGDAVGGTGVSDLTADELGSELDDLVGRLESSGSGAGAEPVRAENEQVGAGDAVGETGVRAPAADAATEAEAVPAAGVDAGTVDETGGGAVSDLSADELSSELDDLMARAVSGAAADAPARVPAADAEGPAPEADLAAQATDHEAVAEVDDRLAADADSAIAGEFETVTDVLQDGGGEPLQEQVEAPDGAAPSDQTPRHEQPALHDEAELEGDFEPPEEVLADELQGPTEPEADPSTLGEPSGSDGTDQQADDTVHEHAGTAEAAALGAGGFDADAATVAAELDAEPAARGATDGPESSSDTVGPGRVSGTIRLLGGDVLEACCGSLNRPLSSLSPQSRQLVGYVGLLTLFNGAVLCIYALVRLWLAR